MLCRVDTNPNVGGSLHILTLFHLICLFKIEDLSYKCTNVWTCDDFYVHQLKVDYGYISINCNISALKQDVQCISTLKTPHGPEI